MLGITSNVTLIFYDFPLPFHAAALPAAVAARCAARHEEEEMKAKIYWSMQLHIMSGFDLYSVNETRLRWVFSAYAGSVYREVLNEATFGHVEELERCYDEKETKSDVVADVRYAETERNVSGTPWVLVNGRWVNWASVEAAVSDINGVGTLEKTR